MNPITQLEDTILAYAASIERRREATLAAERRAREEKAKQAGNVRTLQDSDLVYAAHDRCPCGAGLAYPCGSAMDGCWDCSDILTGRAIRKGQEGWKTHTAKLPFMFYELKSEKQPSANGATTRPAKNKCESGLHEYEGGLSHNDPVYMCKNCGKVDY